MGVKLGYKQTAVGVIPEDWEVKPIAGIATTVASGRSSLDSEFGDFPVYGSTGTIGRSLKGDYEGRAILIARVGANAGTLNVVDGEYGVTDNTIIVRISDSVLWSYVWRQLDAKGLNSMVFGSGQPLITGTQIKNLLIPFPPTKAEQEAIAEALSDADALIESLEQLLTKKRQIKKGAMQELLTGKRRLPGFSGKWEAKRLGEFVSIRNQKVLPSCIDPDTPCIELDHIGQGNGRLLECSTAQHSTSSKYRFFTGDVLFGRLRSYLCKFWHADREGICSTEIWPLVVDSSQAERGFLFAVVQSDRFIATASISYGTHMPRADWDVMRNFPVRLPKVEEQTAIATILSDMDAEIAALEARLSKARQIKQGMMQELLTGRTRLV